MTALGRVYVAQQTFSEPVETVALPTEHLLQCQLLPRQPHSHDSRACFSRHWRSTQFEPLGTAFFLPAAENIHLRSNIRRAVTVTCVYQPESIQSWFGDELEWTDTRLRRCLDIANPTLHNLLFRLSEEIRTPSFGSETLMELISGEIVIELARYCLGIEERARAGGLAPWRLRIIDERLAEPGHRPSLTELAALCHLSARQLTRAFRISRGCSIGTYVAQSRIEHAKRLLKTEQNVKSIAYTLGFNSPSHFYLAFHRATGETPRQYRQRVRRAEEPVS